MQKKALRLAYSEKRKKLSPESRERKSLELANRCLDLPVWDRQTFHLFLSIPGKAEVDTTPLLTILQGRDKDVAIPRVSGPGELQHFLLTDATRLKQNNWGIPEPVAGITVEPEALDVVFLPLLAFDRSGCRVGYGGGYYDRFLSRCRGDALKVGLTFFPPVDMVSDCQPWDVPMDYCVTPEKIYAF